MLKLFYKTFQLIIFSFLFSCSQNNYIEKIKIIKTDRHLREAEQSFLDISKKLSVYDYSKPSLRLDIIEGEITYNDSPSIKDVEGRYEIFTEDELGLKEYKNSCLYNLASNGGKNYIYGKEIDGSKKNLIVLDQNIESLVKKSFVKRILVLKKNYLTNEHLKINIKRLWLVSKKSSFPNPIGKAIGQIIIQIKYKNIDKVYEFSDESTHFISSSDKNNKMIIENLIDKAVNEIVYDKQLEDYIVNND